MAHYGNPWRTSTFSAGANCLGVRELSDGVVQVCNTKRPEAGLLAFGPVAMAAWVAACKDGEFDDTAA